MTSQYLSGRASTAYPAGASKNNYLQTGTSSSTGWVATGAITVTTVSTNIPRGSTTGIGVQFAAGAVNDFAYYNFTLDAADYTASTQMIAQWAQDAVSGYTAGDFKIDVYGYATSSYVTPVRYSLTTDSASVTSLGNFTGIAKTSFTSSSSLIYCQLRITRVANSSTMVLSDITLGSGIGFHNVIDLVETATPSAPVAGCLRFYSKSDNNLYVQTSSGTETQVGSGSGSGGLTPVYQASSFTASTNKNYLCNTTSGPITATLPAGSSGATLQFVDDSGTWATNNLIITPSSGQTIQGIAVNGSLACNLSGAFAQLSWDATNSYWTVTTNSYTNGANGNLTSSYQATSFTAGSGYNYQVNTTSGPVTATLPTGSAGATIQFIDDAGTWATNALTITPNGSQQIQGITAGSSLVANISGAFVLLTWDSTNSWWTVTSNGFYYTPVYSPGAQAGILPATGIPGNTSGTAIAAGFVGEQLSASSSGVAWASTGVTQDVVSKLFTAGVWLITASCQAYYGSAFSAASGANANTFLVSVSTTSGGYNGNTIGCGGHAAFVATTLMCGATTVPTVFSFSTSTTVYANITNYYSSQTGGTNQGVLTGVRIA